MLYTPGNVPIDSENIGAFLTEELNRIKISSNINDDRISVLETLLDRYYPAEDHPAINLFDGPTSNVMWNTGDFIQFTAGATRSILTINFGLGTIADVELLCTFLRFPPVGNVGNNAWPLAIRISGSGASQNAIIARANNGVIEVYELIAGAFNLLGNYAPTYFNPPYPISLKAVGTTVTIADSDGSANYVTALTTAGEVGYIQDFWNRIPTALSRNYIVAIP